MKRRSLGRSEGRTSQGERPIRNKVEKRKQVFVMIIFYVKTAAQHVKIIAQVSKVKSTSPPPHRSWMITLLQTNNYSSLGMYLPWLFFISTQIFLKPKRVMLYIFCNLLPHLPKTPLQLRFFFSSCFCEAHLSRAHWAREHAEFWSKFLSMICAQSLHICSPFLVC